MAKNATRGLRIAVVLIWGVLGLLGEDEAFLLAAAWLLFAVGTWNREPVLRRGQWFSHNPDDYR